VPGRPGASPAPASFPMTSSGGSSTAGTLRRARLARSRRRVRASSSQNRVASSSGSRSSCADDGGNGTLLAGILRVTRGPRGIVFDLPHVVERAKAHLADEGVADRCTAVGGGFFREVPRGGDAYVLKHVIHDWNDEQAVQILTTCRRAMEPDGRLLI